MIALLEYFDLPAARNRNGGKDGVWEGGGGGGGGHMLPFDSTPDLEV